MTNIVGLNGKNINGKISNIISGEFNKDKNNGK